MSENGSHFHSPKDVALQSATYTFPHELIMSFGLEGEMLSGSFIGTTQRSNRNWQTPQDLCAECRSKV